MKKSSNSRLVDILRWNSRRWLLLILVIYTLLAIGYGIATPLFEGPDEHHHFYTLKVIALSHRLPTTFDDTNVLTGQEAAQPPLYYVVAAFISAPFGENAALEALWPNPSVQLGAPGSPQNINAFVHGPDEQWPWQGLALEAHLIRFFSTLIGLGTLLCIYGSGRLFWPDAAERALLATALVAFLPQFAFLHAYITNDVLIIFMSAFVLWQLLRLWYTGTNWRRLSLLGISLGLAILSKSAGLLLLAYALGFLTVTTLRDESGLQTPKIAQRWFLRLGLVTGIALLISGWSLWRNWRLYGDITGSSQILRYFGGDRGYTLLEVFRESSGLWDSMFAVFGSFNIIPPPWVYFVWNGLVLAAIIGVVLEILKRLPAWRTKIKATQNVTARFQHPSQILNWPGLPGVLLGIWVLIIYLALIWFMLQIHAGQGRLLFPALLPLALGLVFGLSRYRWPGIIILASSLALATSVYCLLFVIPPAYALPPIITEVEVPSEANRLEFDLGQGLELVAVQTETEESSPGEWVFLTLYWKAESVPGSAAEKDAPMAVLELFGQNNESAGKLQSYHGRGLYPANLWQPGQLVADRIAVRLEEGMATPVLVRLNVKLAGENQSVDVGSVKVSPSQWPDRVESSLATLDGIELAEAEISRGTAGPGEIVNLHLRWQVESAPGRDLTTFVHLGDLDFPPLAQGDSPPVGGHYPTRLWAAGEVISDSYSLTVPENIAVGRYPIFIGLYDPDSGIRIPLKVDGESQVGDAYLAGWITVP